MIESFINFWIWNKESIILTAVAGVVFALAYELTTIAVQRIFKQK
jgi:hypothetical protein